jgi:hypothetical protein
MRKLWTSCILGLALVAAASGAQAQGAMHGRVSHDEGGLLVRGNGDGEWAHATTNTMVLPGDTLWIDETGVGEVELPQGSFLRLADTSKIEVSALDPNIALRAWSGSFYVQRMNRSAGNLVMDTPAATVQVSPDTSVRVDVLADGNSTVSVRWGRADVRTPRGGAVTLTAGQRAYIDPGLLPSDAVPFDPSSEDSFDAWSRERAEYLATGSTTVPAEVTVAPATMGVSDLSNYGEWVYVDSRPLWRPTVVMNYVPYRTGYWNYVPGYGHVWVGNEPFGYVTSHYGRWNHYANYGWCWSYDPVWRPAWVVSVRCGDYFAWAPCDYYNRPVLMHDSAYFDLGGVRFSVYGSSYVRCDQAYYGPRYVNPWRQDVFAPYLHGGPDTVVNINIWNIDSDRDRPRVNPFNDDVFTVRDYNPSRSIRGVASLQEGGVRAVDRAQQLEQRLGRSEFAGVARQRGEGQARTARVDAAREAAPRAVRVERKGETSFGRMETNPDARTARGVRGGDATITNESAERASVRPINRVRGGESNTTGTPSENPRGNRVSRIDMDGVSPVTGEEQPPSRPGVRDGGATSGTPGVTRPRGTAPAETPQRSTAPSVRERGGEKPSGESVRVERTPVRENAVPRTERSTTPPASSRTTTRPVEGATRGYESPTRRQTKPAEQAPSVRSTQPSVRSGESSVTRQRERYQAPSQSAPSVTQPSGQSPRVERSTRERAVQPSRQSLPESSAPSTRYNAAPAQRERVRVQPVQPTPQPESSGRFAPQRGNSVSVAPSSRDLSGRGAVSVRPQNGEGRGNSNSRGR